MMKIKQLKLLNKDTMNLIACVLICFISTSCKSQINILSNEIDSIRPSSQMKNNYLYGIFETLLNDESMENWKKREKKIFFVSALEKNNNIIVRIIPKVREKYSMPILPNTYSAYFMYKDIFVVYWGNEKIFFDTTGNKFKANLFEYKKEIVDQKDDEGNDIIIINNEEYYGYEFLIKNDKFNLIEKNYFDSPLIKDN